MCRLTDMVVVAELKALAIDAGVIKGLENLGLRQMDCIYSTLWKEQWSFGSYIHITLFKKMVCLGAD